MPLRTTVIGSYPKPEYLRIPDWFKDQHHAQSVPTQYNKFIENVTYQSPEEFESVVDQALDEVLNEQISFGIDVITDGEVRRENYINYFCRRISGIDFNELALKTCRDGGWEDNVPTIRSNIDIRHADGVNWIKEEWERTQGKCETQVKMTLPGPMTIIGSTANMIYKNIKTLSEDLTKVLNAHIKCLAAAGCRNIQLDEPLLTRDPDTALEYGVDHAARCFEGVGFEVTKTIHLCCGYPNYLDQVGYPKADNDAYLKLADKLDQAGFDQISLEDAHRRNDLSLFDRFKKSTIILGSITVANSRVETVDEIRSRLREVLKHVPAERLVVAPDCGLGYLTRDILRAKMTNMMEAARSLP